MCKETAYLTCEMATTMYIRPHILSTRHDCLSDNIKQIYKAALSM